jgi:hypothetical protein
MRLSHVAGADDDRSTKLRGCFALTTVSSRWEGELDRGKLRAAMAHPLELGEALDAGSA